MVAGGVHFSNGGDFAIGFVGVMGSFLGVMGSFFSEMRWIHWRMTYGGMVVKQITVSGLYNVLIRKISCKTHY